MLTGQALIDDINATHLPHGQYAFWWLGQHSFIVKLGEVVIYIDPFLTPMKERNVPPLFKPQEITNATLVLGSHDHLDHIDRLMWPGIAEGSPAAKFVVPDMLKENLAAEIPFPIQKLVGLDDERSVVLNGLKISALASSHEFFDRCPETGRYPYLGFIIEGHGVTIYHPGDTVVYEGLKTKLSKWKIDIMFLPINGRDAERLASGCIGNMTYQEAADLAGGLNPGMVMPTHYEMFTGNPGDPQAFSRYLKVKYPRQKHMIAEPGVKYELGAGV